MDALNNKYEIFYDFDNYITLKTTLCILAVITTYSLITL